MVVRGDNLTSGGSPRTACERNVWAEGTAKTTQRGAETTQRQHGRRRAVAGEQGPTRGGTRRRNEAAMRRDSRTRRRAAIRMGVGGGEREVREGEREAQGGS